MLKNWAMLCAAEEGSTGGCYVMVATFNFQEQKLLELKPFDLEVHRWRGLHAAQVGSCMVTIESLEPGALSHKAEQ